MPSANRANGLDVKHIFNNQIHNFLDCVFVEDSSQILGILINIPWSNMTRLAQTRITNKFSTLSGSPQDSVYKQAGVEVVRYFPSYFSVPHFQFQGSVMFQNLGSCCQVGPGF